MMVAFLDSEIERSSTGDMVKNIHLIKILAMDSITAYRDKWRHHDVEMTSYNYQTVAKSR